MASSATSERHRALARLSGLIATACLVLLSVEGALAQQSSGDDGNPAIVERIEIVGNRRIESATIRRLIHLSPGDRYSAEAVDRGLTELRNSGFWRMFDLK